MAVATTAAPDNNIYNIIRDIIKKNVLRILCSDTYGYKN